jgi:hypothetical protein
MSLFLSNVPLSKNLRIVNNGYFEATLPLSKSLRRTANNVVILKKRPFK